MARSATRRPNRRKTTRRQQDSRRLAVMYDAKATAALPAPRKAPAA